MGPEEAKKKGYWNEKKVPKSFRKRPLVRDENVFFGVGEWDPDWKERDQRIKAARRMPQELEPKDNCDESHSFCVESFRSNFRDLFLSDSQPPSRSPEGEWRLFVCHEKRLFRRSTLKLVFVFR
jgi:hypothetical protein